MAFDVGKKGGTKSDINVVPLVDIVLVLLIIFIVITPAINDAVVLPLSKYSVKQDLDSGSKYLSLILTKNPERDPVTKLFTMQDIMVDGAENKERRFDFSNNAERDRLIAFVKSNVDQLYGDKRVFIKADGKLPFHYVNDLLQICREAGADEASAITNEDKSGKDDR
jgi:biopolymer transport protein ExbD/biopolymer transport protein TolR